MNNSFLTLVAMTAIAGGLLPVQSAINASLASRAETNVIWAALVSVACSTITMIVVAALTLDRWPRLSAVAHVPAWMWAGGLVGAVFVVTSAFVMPRIGAGVFVTAVLLGQIVVSLAMDHNGWFGVPADPISLHRIFGVLLIFGGLLLIRGL